MAALNENDWAPRCCIDGNLLAQLTQTITHKMRKKTTNPIRNASGARVAAALLLLALAACSTARLRDEPRNMLGSLRFRDAEAQRYFDGVYRSGDLYQDFRPVLVVDAIYKDQRYRTLYVHELQERMFLGAQQVADLTTRNQEAYDNTFEFVVFLYEGENPEPGLNQANSRWRVMLTDDDGQLIPPASMRRIGKNSPDFQYIDKYFYGVDRWSAGYVVTFPKLNKRLLGQAPGAAPMKLIVTGIAGTVSLAWDDVALFFAGGG